jgi:hypothetical protein
MTYEFKGAVRKFEGTFCHSASGARPSLSTGALRRQSTYGRCTGVPARACRSGGRGYAITLFTWGALCNAKHETICARSNDLVCLRFGQDLDQGYLMRFRGDWRTQGKHLLGLCRSASEPYTQLYRTSPYALHVDRTPAVFEDFQGRNLHIKATHSLIKHCTQHQPGSRNSL